MHEIATDVHFHYITRNGIVLTFFPDMFFKPPYTIVRTVFLDATVAVVDESALIHLMRVVVVHAVIARIEVEVPRVVRVVRVERTRPVVAVAACVVETTIVAVARSRQEETPLN